MTNYERYEKNIKDFLLEHGHAEFAVVNNKIIDCNSLCCCGEDCYECLFDNEYDSCEYLRKKWFNEECKER